MANENYYWLVSDRMTKVIMTVALPGEGPLTISLPVKHARQLAMELLAAAERAEDTAAVWSGGGKQ